MEIKLLYINNNDFNLFNNLKDDILLKKELDEFSKNMNL